MDGEYDDDDDDDDDDGDDDDDYIADDYDGIDAQDSGDNEANDHTDAAHDGDNTDDDNKTVVYFPDWCVASLPGHQAYSRTPSGSVPVMVSPSGMRGTSPLLVKDDLTLSLNFNVSRQHQHHYDSGHLMVSPSGMRRTNCWRMKNDLASPQNFHHSISSIT